MINKIFAAVFAPKHPRGYTGRHRAPDAEPATLTIALHGAASIPLQRVA